MCSDIFPWRLSVSRSEQHSSRKTVSFEEQIMSTDRYPSIFSRQMEAIVYITLHVFLYLVPTKPPDNIDATILETFVKISWDKVPEESRNGEILGYRITYYQEGNKTYQRSETKPHDFFSIHLKSLGKFSKYHIKILAYTRIGDGKVGNISFKTSDDSK